MHYVFYYIHTEIYSQQNRKIHFRSETDANRSNGAYRFFICAKSDTSIREPRIMFFFYFFTFEPYQVEVFIEGRLAAFLTQAVVWRS